MKIYRFTLRQKYDPASAPQSFVGIVGIDSVFCLAQLPIRLSVWLEI
jgi:hypothetical protein